MKGMLVAVLAVASAFMFTMGTSAQESSAPKEHSMTGCLKAGTSPDTFMLTDLEKGPKTVGIVSTSAKLTPHVGHKVEITGTAVPKKEAEAMKDAPQADHYMKVTAVKMISSTCP